MTQYSAMQDADKIQLPKSVVFPAQNGRDASQHASMNAAL
jgi:hypothetical protein